MKLDYLTLEVHITKLLLVGEYQDFQISLCESWVEQPLQSTRIKLSKFLQYNNGVLVLHINQQYCFGLSSLQTNVLVG